MESHIRFMYYFFALISMWVICFWCYWLHGFELLSPETLLIFSILVWILQELQNINENLEKKWRKKK